MKHYLYYLVDPQTQARRWVGTTTDPDGRMASHLYCASRGLNANTTLDEWVNSTVPEMKVICVFGQKVDAIEAETRLIRLLVSRGELLLNKLIGRSYPDSTREKISSSQKQAWAEGRHSAHSDAIKQAWRDGKYKHLSYLQLLLRKGGQ